MVDGDLCEISWPVFVFVVVEPLVVRDPFDEGTLDGSDRAHLRRCIARAVNVSIDRVRLLSVRDFRRRRGARVTVEVVVRKEDAHHRPASMGCRGGGYDVGASRTRANSLAQELASGRFALSLTEGMVDLQPPLVGFAQDSIQVQSVAVLLLGEL